MFKPSNHGMKWTVDEENKLLEELSDKDVIIIAKNHNRTTGSIHSKRNEIAYKMHVNGTDMEDIMKKTKFDILFEKVVIVIGFT